MKSKSAAVIPPSLHPLVDDDSLRCLGLVFIRFSELEFRVNTFLMTLLNVDSPRGRAVTLRMSFSEQLESIKRLLVIEQLPAPLREEILAVASRCNSEEARRNQLAHSVWAFGPEGEISRMKTRKDTQIGVKWHSETIDAPGLLKDAQRIEQRIIELNLATLAYFHLKNPTASREILAALDPDLKWIKLLEST